MSNGMNETPTGLKKIFSRVLNSIRHRLIGPVDVNDLASRVDGDLLALVKQVEGLGRDQARFSDSITEQVQLLTNAVSELQAQIYELRGRDS